jgi:hypothetical protein
LSHALDYLCGGIDPYETSACDTQQSSSLQHRRKNSPDSGYTETVRDLEQQFSLEECKALARALSIDCHIQGKGGRLMYLTQGVSL